MLVGNGDSGIDLSESVGVDRTALSVRDLTGATLYEQTLEHLLEPIQELLLDGTVSEVLINTFDEIYVERRGRLSRVPHHFEDEAALRAALRNVCQFVGKRLTPESQSIEARLPDGSRVHVIQPPAAPAGLCAAIRKFQSVELDLASLVTKGSVSKEAGDFLAQSVELAKNVLVSGGTGSGKTTLLNALSSAIPEAERVIVIEDSSELQLQQEHVLCLEAKPSDHNKRGGVSIRELFRASLRMRPDRIVVGECRGGEALDMIQAMTSGHSGSMSTLHADTPYDALNRLETMSLMANVELPLHALRQQIASALDLLVQTARLRDGRRCITAICEVLKLDEDGRHQLATLYSQDVPFTKPAWAN